MEAIQEYPNLLEENRRLCEEKENLRQKLQSLQERVKYLETMEITYKEISSLDDFEQYLHKVTASYREKLLHEEAERLVETQLPKSMEKKLKLYSNSYPNDVPRYFSKVVENLAWSRGKELVENKAIWPKWLQDMINTEISMGIKAGLNADFDSRVQKESHNRINELVQYEWPRFLREHVTPFIIKNIQEQLLQLRMQFNAKCDKCGITYWFNLSPEMISELYMKGSTKVPCSNTACRGIFGRNHMFSVSFANIIEQIMSKPIKLYPVKPTENKEDEEEEEFKDQE